MLIALGGGCDGLITGAGGGGGGTGGGGGVATAPGGNYFPNGSVFYQDISDAPLASSSDATIQFLDQAGGFGGGSIRIDFSINVLTADDSTPMEDLTPSGDFYSPDCDQVAVPVPDGGALEGEDGYSCTTGGDCHLIVAQEQSMKLYEMWEADMGDGSFSGGCLAVWDMSKVYGPEGRGLNCTSADAAGLPIAPLLFNADEVAAGSIDHAIRFILPNSRIQGGEFMSPATHSTGAASAGADGPPYGTRLRLRADYPIDGLSPGAQVVARAMQQYGMILADGGTIALTAQSDQFTEHSWEGLLGPEDLSSIPITAFEVVDAGQMTAYTGDCRRVEQ